jgi:hypothetical protein
MERESFPVGILIPQFDCKIRTAFYGSVQTSIFSFVLQAHIQFADNEIQTAFDRCPNNIDKASAIAVLLPETGSVKLQANAL